MPPPTPFLVAVVAATCLLWAYPSHQQDVATGVAVFNGLVPLDELSPQCSTGE